MAGIGPIGPGSQTPESKRTDAHEPNADVNNTDPASVDAAETPVEQVTSQEQVSRTVFDTGQECRKQTAKNISPAAGAGQYAESEQRDGGEHNPDEHNEDAKKKKREEN